MRPIAGEIPGNSNALITAIIEKSLGQRVDEFKQIVGLGFNNAVTVASTAAGDFVVRTNVESHLFRFEREAWCLHQMHDHGVLVPEVMGCGIEQAHSFSVARYVAESSPIHAGIDQLRVWKTLGRYAAILNSITESEMIKTATHDPIFPSVGRNSSTRILH